MSTRLALLQPGPPPTAEATCAPACTDCSLSSEPSDIPRIPAPPTRSKSRRLGRRCASHKSLAFEPIIRNMGSPRDQISCDECRMTNVNPPSRDHSSFVIRHLTFVIYINGCTKTPDY